MKCISLNLVDKILSYRSKCVLVYSDSGSIVSSVTLRGINQNLYIFCIGIVIKGRKSRKLIHLIG